MGRSAMQERMRQMMQGGGQKDPEPVQQQNANQDNYQQQQGGQHMQQQQYEGEEGQYDPNNVQVQYEREDRRVGIHTIEIYTPQFYYHQTDMEEFDARPDRYGPSVIGKYTKGIGQVQARYPSDDEDPISFAMTVMHRLVERMEDKGFNFTGQYSPDGEALPGWNAIGRLDIGTESITDRSKSMKSHVMDLFERYGNEDNVEGVDQYNACYGGQAAGLAVVAWLESDRWDGRYGVAIATDISDAEHTHMFTVGAACTATLFFPDAPIAHHSVRASCVLHRFDFYKPVGWHSMAPIVDGKYSIECYMDAIDACYGTMKKKMGGVDIIPLMDYNVFHTGGGFHVVKKAFERILRNDNPNLKSAERQDHIEKKLLPSCHLLKIIGPCHTVSSFLNISSVIMSQWESAIGKILWVYTYGSGCAATWYQLRIDGLAFFDQLEVWKTKFYQDAILMSAEASGPLHQVYFDTWMKFDFEPQGRKQCGIDLTLYQKDVYYMMEIDKFGRRFYHRGGLMTGPLEAKYLLPADEAEERSMREKFGPIPKKALEGPKITSKEEERRALEYEMTFDYEADTANNYEVVEEYVDRYNPKKVTKIYNPKAEKSVQELSIDPDGEEHSYTIAGSWNRWGEPQEMIKDDRGNFTFDVTLGENRWEAFYIIQDLDVERRIYPSDRRSYKDRPCIGPLAGKHDGKDHLWFLDGRERVSVDEQDVGMPGDVYRVTFTWEKLKELTWTKLTGQTKDWAKGQYYLYGSMTDWEYEEISPDEDMGEGYYSTEVMMTSLGLEFCLARSEDHRQHIYPVPMPKARDSGEMEPITQESRIAGPDDGRGGNWKIKDQPGAVYKITFYRDPDDVEPLGMSIEWEKIDDRPVVEPTPRYYIAGNYNTWGEDGFTKMSMERPGVYTGRVKYGGKHEPFQIVEHKLWSRCVHPDKDGVTQVMAQAITKDGKGQTPPLTWHIGKHPGDKARRGDVFIVKFESKPDGKKEVTWVNEKNVSS